MMKRTLNNKHAFTLIEILMVVIVLGAISALALPRYGKMMEQRYAYNAKLNLMSIHSAVQIYLLKNPALGIPSNKTTTPDVNTALGSNIVDSNFTYTLIDANVPVGPDHNQARAYRPTSTGAQYFLGIILDQPIGSTNPFCTNGSKACPIGNNPWEY